MPDVQRARRGSALWLTIAREERRNALNAAVLDALRDGVLSVRADPEIRAVVITGAGERVFCAGGDLKPDAEGDPFRIDPAERDNPVVRLFQEIIDAPLPVIARVNGHALAGGFGLVCACDFAIVADHARLGTPEARVGLFPMMILPFMLRTVPRRKLLELCVTGEPISAADALAHGIVNHVVPLADLDAKIDALVAAIAAGSRRRSASAGERWPRSTACRCRRRWNTHSGCCHSLRRRRTRAKGFVPSTRSALRCGRDGEADEWKDRTGGMRRGLLGRQRCERRATGASRQYRFSGVRLSRRDHHVAPGPGAPTQA
jgi:enoyl-CoA hydratase/carnithine racemase